MSRTLVFIPAYNEAENVVNVIQSIKEYLPDVDLLIIDDGSTDQTVLNSKKMGADVASLPFNQGLGAALQTGYLQALRGDYQFCAHLDADGQHRPEDLQILLEAVMADECDLAVGSRYLTAQKRGAEENVYQANFSRSVGSKLFRLALTMISGQRFTDTTSGLRAANRKVIKQFANTYSADFAELESLQRTITIGLRVREYPVIMLERFSGKSKIGLWQSLHFTFKSALVLFVGSLRKRRERYNYQRGQSDD